MKNALFIFFILLTNFFVRSQVSSYSFTTSTGTYSPIVGGTNNNNFTTWTNSSYTGTLPNTTNGFLDDNVSSALLPIGFNFTYNGVVYTNFGICTNGWISLGSLPTNTTTPLSLGTSNNVISALGADLIGRGSLLANRTSGSAVITITGGDISQISVGDKVSGTGIPANATVLSKTATTVTISANATTTGTGFHFRFSNPNFGIRYETIGTSPNRTLVVQWTGWQRYTTTGVFGELYNFQIRLNETTNTIDVIYNMSGPSSITTTTFQIGLRGSANTDFNDRTTTTNWSSTTAGTSNSSTVTLSNTVKPTSGLIYTWAPPSCVAPSSLLITYTSPTSANLSWVASSSLPTNGYEWEIRTSGLGGSGATGLVASGSVGAGVTSASTSSLTQNTTYTLYVRSNCGGLYSSWNASSSSTSPVPAPSNDACSNATLLPCGTSGLAGTTVGSVLETAPLGYSSPYGVWYSFVGDGQSTTISTVAGTGFDHEMVIMSGTTCGATYTLITDQDVGFSGGTETYTFTTVNGTQYYIYIAYYSTTGLSTNTGTFTMSRTCVAPPTPPVNDNPSGAISITINTGTYSTYTNVNATSTSVTSPSCASYAGEDVWFSVVVPSNGIVELDMIEGVITDGGMSVYTGAIGSLTEVACDDDNSTNGLMPYLYLTGLGVGQTIYVRVWEYGGGTTGTFGILANSPISLPIELIYFDGVTYPSFNSLRWSTASEHNSDYFEIERSVDGEMWKVVGNKSASGNSTIVINYNYLDSFDDLVIHYYRLKQVDYDGQYKIYGPISLDNTKSVKKIVKYINLIGQEVNLDTKGFIFEVYEDGTMRKIIR